jgi:predicted secreted protein
MIRTVLAASALVLAATPGLAGNFSEFRPIGFSNHGGVFAFEEFGIQDGSGFAYATRYYIDTTTDKYLPGTPVRVTLQEETSSVNDARAEAARQAADIEASSGAADDPGVFAAFQPATEPQSDPTFLLYQPFAIEPYPGDAWAASLIEKTLAPSSNCAAFDQADKGFRLELKKAGEPAAPMVLHDDASIPNSRRCPIAYQIAGAMAHANPDGSTTHAILVLVRSVGFEGPDGRYIAVTKRID